MKKQKRKNLTLNMSTVYVAVALIFVFGFGFFGTSKLFLAEDFPINQTELNTEFDLRSNGKFLINSWIYDEEQNKMEVILVTNGMQDYTSEMNFSAVSRTNLHQELPVNVVFQDNEIFILEIDNVPKNFDQIAIRLNKTERNLSNIFDEPEFNQDNKMTVSTIYTDERVVERKTIEELDDKGYTRRVTDSIIEQTEEQKKEIEKKIEGVNGINEEINEEIKELKSELLYQTVEEQMETNNKIYRLERDLETNKGEIETMQQDIYNLDSKIERMNQKKRDIGI